MMGDAQRTGRAAANERMRRSRELRRKGLRCIDFRIRETEVAELIRRRLLAETDRDDSNAIETALGKLLDQMLAPKHTAQAR
jgi:hypothetical protein